MEYDHELIKDLITEKDPTLKREDIVIENVWDHNIRMGEIIIIEFYTKIVKNVHGVERDFIKRENHTISIYEYNQRFISKQRTDKLNKLGI